MLSDDKIAEVKKRISKSRNARSKKLNGKVLERVRNYHRSRDILLTQ